MTGVQTCALPIWLIEVPNLSEEEKTHNSGWNICPRSKFVDEFAIPES